MKNFTEIILIFMLIGLVGLQLFILKSLDYSTSSISWYSIEQEKKEPAPSPNFKIGNLEFDVVNYSNSSDLQPLRAYFQENCSNLKGIKAASCLSENFIRKIPFGEPSDELFDKNYSPVNNFQQHLNGKPGHCVSYSGMTAATLLSVGIPARMVQVLPKGKGGHNIIEVWDQSEGWVVFDPLSDTLLTADNNKYLSAFEALSSKTSVKRVEAGQENIDKGYLTDYYSGETPFDNAITYPDPWLYTRIGNKDSWLYRGSFVAFGDGFWKYGGLQNILRYSIVLCSLAILCLMILFVKKCIVNYCNLKNNLFYYSK